jgi:hypothetical protein
VFAAQNQKGEWHVTKMSDARSEEEAKRKTRIEALRKLIRENPNSGQEDLTQKASESKICSQKQARRLLKEGDGKYWEIVVHSGSKKQTFRVLEKAA